MNVSILAESMNVTESDVSSLLRMVAESLKSDGMKDIFCNMSKEEQATTIQAYVQAEVNKFSEFCFSIMVNTEKKSAFSQYMYAKLNGENK